MRGVITALFLTIVVYATVHSQTCSAPYNLGGIGTWSYCWEAPAPFESFDTCFDFFPLTATCPPQCGGAYLQFEVGSTGLATFMITSDLNYSNLTSGPELPCYFYILNIDCSTPVFYAGTCGAQNIGWGSVVELWDNDRLFGLFIDDDYTITLSLPSGEYIMVIGNIGTGETPTSSPYGVQDIIEGCVQVDYFTQGVLGFTAPSNPDNDTVSDAVSEWPKLVLITDLLGQDVWDIEPYRIYLYYYSNGSVVKKYSVENNNPR